MANEHSQFLFRDYFEISGVDLVRRVARDTRKIDISRPRIYSWRHGSLFNNFLLIILSDFEEPSLDKERFPHGPLSTRGHQKKLSLELDSTCWKMEETLIHHLIDCEAIFSGTFGLGVPRCWWKDYPR